MRGFRLSAIETAAYEQRRAESSDFGVAVRLFGHAVDVFVGIAAGTYSSIFIAAPVLILFKLRGETFRAGIDKEEPGEKPDKGPAPGVA